MKLLRLSLSVAVCFLFSACVIPYHYLDRPGVDGVVVNARTSQPIAGAELELGERNTTASTRSASDGSFLIPPQKHWGIYIVPADIFPQPSPLVIKHVGFRPYTDKIGPGKYRQAHWHDEIADLGTVKMQPNP